MSKSENQELANATADAKDSSPREIPLSSASSSSSVYAPQWYPGPPPDALPTNAAESFSQHFPAQPDPKERLLGICKELNVKYLDSNYWGGIPKDLAQETRRYQVKGTEVRPLPPGHFLHGQYGLFATQRFHKFDVIGEYVGKIVGKNSGGHYVAALEDKSHEDSLGIDAEHWGNEMRFINSYMNIGFKANVTMRTAYVNTFPHILIVAQEDIEVDEELLLDYGEAYTQAYLTPNTRTVEGALSSEELLTALPMGGSSDSEDQK